MGKPAAPPAPDYAAAATAQGVANKDTAVSNTSLGNPNVISPYGNQTVTYDQSGPGGNYQPTITQSLTPEAQRTLDAQQRVQYGLADLGQQGLSTAQGVLGTPFNYNGPSLQTSINGSQPLNYGPTAGQYGQATGNIDTSGVAKMPVNAGMTAQQAILQRLQPQINQNNAAQDQQLANQGITSGSEAWNNAMRTRDQSNNDLYSQAALQGIGVDMSANQQGYSQAANNAAFANQAIGQNYGQGATSAGLYNNAAGQQYNQGLGAAQFGNQAALQAYQQQLAQYNQPLNQITALMSGSQIQNPQFQSYNGSQAAPAPVFQGAQAQGNYNTSVYNSQMQGVGGLYSGLGSLAGAGLSPGGFARGLFG